MTAILCIRTADEVMIWNFLENALWCRRQLEIYETDDDDFSFSISL